MGGFCLPKDSTVLRDSLWSVEEPRPAFREIIDSPRQTYELNQNIIRYHAELVQAITSNCSRVLGVGIAFKGVPQTDDTRDSVGLAIVQHLISAGRNVEVYDRTVSQERLRALNVPLASMPLDLARYDGVLVLNNDPGYVELLPTRPTSPPIVLYDPWRLVVDNNESIYQEQFYGRTLAPLLGGSPSES